MDGSAEALGRSHGAFPTKLNLRTGDRNRVERLTDRLEQFRRIANRYEERVANHLTMVHLDVLVLWLLRSAETVAEGRPEASRAISTITE